MSSFDTVNFLKAPPPSEISNNTAPPPSEISNNTPPEQEPKLVNVEVNNQNTALNLMVTFLSLANRRGVFSLDESAKIWECIQRFQIPDGNSC